MDLINTSFDGNYRRRKEQLEVRGEIFQTYNIDGISSDNEYVPIGAAKMNLGIYNGKVVHYSIPMNNSVSMPTIKTYSTLYRALATRTMPFKFKTSSMESHLTGVKGILFKRLADRNVDILFLVAVKTEYMRKMFEPRENDMSKFAIFVSREFYTSLKYKSLFNKFKREVILPNVERGVELIITNNIEERCFKNNVAKPKFKSVSEMKEYLYSFNQEI